MAARRLVGLHVEYMQLCQGLESLKDTCMEVRVIAHDGLIDLLIDCLISHLGSLLMV